MKPYGVPRVLDIESPDKADIKKYGLATKDRCSRSDRGKNSSRRYWKSVARLESKAIILEEMLDYFD